MNGSLASLRSVGKVSILLIRKLPMEYGMGAILFFLMMKRLADERSALMMRSVRWSSSRSVDTRASFSMMLLGPVSARYPSLMMVSMAPPSLALDSKMVTECPCFMRAYAALSPVMPAPRMAIFFLIVLAVVGDGFNECGHIFWFGSGEYAVAEVKDVSVFAFHGV